LFTVFGPQKTWKNVGFDFGFEYRKSEKHVKVTVIGILPNAVKIIK
jgi:hypothetical protein